MPVENEYYSKQEVYPLMLDWEPLWVHDFETNIIAKVQSIKEDGIHMLAVSLVTNNKKQKGVKYRIEDYGDKWACIKYGSGTGVRLGV